jgi:hypothetical protein
MEALDLSVKQNQEILDARLEFFNRLKVHGPRVGDFVYMLDGTLRRFTYDWGHAIQVSCKDQPGDQSFFLGSCGADYSGSLDSPIDKTKLLLLAETIEGSFWMFDQGLPGGRRGRSFKTHCRVFQQTK